MAVLMRRKRVNWVTVNFWKLLKIKVIAVDLEGTLKLIINGNPQFFKCQLLNSSR